MRDFDIDSDLKQEKFQSLKLVQGDRGNKIKINVYEDGQPVNLAGCSVTAKYKRADGEIINDGVIENIHDNSFDAVMDSSITKVAGTLKMLFTIEKDAVKVRAFLMLADVREGIGENTGSSGGSTGGGSTSEVTIDLSQYYKKTETYSKAQIDSQFKDIAKKKIEYPKLDWEKEALNLKYKYGDIRRYGAKCDGVTDDSDVFQWALDNCSPNGISVYIPEDKITVIAKSIVMKNNSTSNYYYKIKSNQYDINNFCILQKCKNLFVGENFYNDTPAFTQIKAIIKNTAIKVDDSINHGTIFKAIKFISSQIEYNFFYFMYTVIEGSLGAGTKFNNNRIQSYEYSFLSSIATLGEHTFEDIKSIYNNANYNINSLNGLLVVSDENSSDFSRYSCQSNDSFLSNNYFSGARTLTNIPEAVFVVESIDSDFIITNNWFEFSKYVISTLIRATNSGTSLIGTYFNNNIFQNFHRFFNPKSFYTSFSFNSNLFYNFNASKIKTIFSNATDGDIDNFKSGVFISDINENNVPIYTNFSILDSYFELNNYSIYIDTGTTGKYKAFSICEQNSKFKDNDNLPYFRIKNTDDLLKNNFTCFNKYEKTMPECTNLYTTNTFIGRIVFVDDGIYICSWNGTAGEYKKLTTN